MNQKCTGSIIKTIIPPQNQSRCPYKLSSAPLGTAGCLVCAPVPRTKLQHAASSSVWQWGSPKLKFAAVHQGVQLQRPQVTSWQRFSTSEIRRAPAQEGFVCLFVWFTDSGSCRSATLLRMEPALPEGISRLPGTPRRHTLEVCAYHKVLRWTPIFQSMPPQG